MNPDSPANIANLRQDYKLASLDKSDLAQDPFTQFAKWFQEAQSAAITEPNAMTLATVSEQGMPSARIVLLKGFDSQGFCFYTNYESRKGKELAAHPYACLVFLWQELERQVRIEGKVSVMSVEASDTYFHSRPLNSRYGALTSPQSQVIHDRQDLLDQETILRAKYGEHPPRPAHWGGYCLSPLVVEFWQGRRSRLHDRLRFRRDIDPLNEGSSQSPWHVERLAP